MSLRQSTNPWLLKAFPPGTRRFSAAQLVRDAVQRRASVGELLTDARLGDADAQFRRWLAARPLPQAQAAPTDVLVLDEPWTGPDAPPETLVVFAGVGDRFEPGALALIADAALDPGVSLIYWDDALIDSEGRLGSPRFRPEWSPELLLAAPYLHRSFAIRRGRLGTAGDRLGGTVGPDSATGGVYADSSAALWDLLLHCQFTAREVARLPLVLQGVADRSDQVDVDVANAALRRSGLPATMGRSGAISWAPDTWPTVTIVIPTRHNRDDLTSLLPALESTTYPDFDVVMIDNAGRTGAREAWYEANSGGLDLTVEWWERPFNYSAVNNHGAAIGRGETLVFLNDDAVPLHPTWLENLVGWLEIPEVGLVGGFLLDATGRLDHAGIVVGMHSLAGHLLRTCWPDEVTIFGPANWPRNVLAVTGACTAVRRSTFEVIGGFDERFELTGSDVALGVAAVEAGFRNVCTPWARLRHEERSTRGTSDPEGDTALAMEVLADWLQAGDPWYSPNLSLRSPRPQLRSRGEIGR
jgi:GT2 family glycosyltransferase